jgi:hypothetical protein
MTLPWYLQEPFAPAQPQDLVLWLNSSSWDGTTWRNLAPSYSNVNHGTLVNGVAIGDLIHPSGVFGAPRKFDGTDDYVDCGNDSSLDITDAITIEAWVKSALSVVYYLFCRGLANNDGYYSYIRGTGEIGFKTNQSGSNQTTESSAGTLTADEWQHIIITRDGATGKIYLNGQEISYKIQDSHSDPVTSGRNLYIGQSDTGTARFNGSIDGVKIYNRALSAADVVHNHTHSPIYYMQHGIDPLSLLSQTPQEAAYAVV